MAEENHQAESNAGATDSNTPTTERGSTGAEPTPAGEANGAAGGVRRAHRSQKVGSVVSDKMQKTVVVRVDRLVRHTKYRRYVRRTSKFMAHDELGATIGDKVRIVETRPMSARKRWRVIEIVQKAAK
jgi:small subunit ribosomal protein S17